MITQLNTLAPSFAQDLAKLLNIDTIADTAIVASVANIIACVRKDGDDALLKFSQQFDKLSADTVAQLELNQTQLKSAFEALSEQDKSALTTAAQRIEYYHIKQKQDSWQYTQEDGTMLGQQITPLDRVGLYVPGGKASYPSSVLMNALPAKVAGVQEIIMTVPAPKGELNPMVLAAAYICGVNRVFMLGGAQAIAALAYGTQSIAKVDKIVGPGNIYVATAKKMVFGQVGIDMIAGPSEILIICDGKTNPDWVAMDLFSQAEHDEDAQSILLCPSQSFINEVLVSIKKLLPTMDRANIIQKALKNRGALICTQSLEQAIKLSNTIAPEHLELSVDNPEQYLPDIKHAGAIFMGRYTCEALGDYCAGPNHVLPTSGTARFSSALGVYDFQKRSNLIYASKQGANTLGKIASTLAQSEGLQAHQLSAQYRLDK